MSKYNKNDFHLLLFLFVHGLNSAITSRMALETLIQGHLTFTF
jgi:hypothetical protein